MKLPTATHLHRVGIFVYTSLFCCFIQFNVPDGVLRVRICVDISLMTSGDKHPSSCFMKSGKAYIVKLILLWSLYFKLLYIFPYGGQLFSYWLITLIPSDRYCWVMCMRYVFLHSEESCNSDFRITEAVNFKINFSHKWFFFSFKIGTTWDFL